MNYNLFLSTEIFLNTEIYFHQTNMQSTKWLGFVTVKTPGVNLAEYIILLTVYMERESIEVRIT